MRTSIIQRSFSLGALALASLCAAGMADAQTTTAGSSGSMAASGVVTQRAGAKIAGSDSAFLKQAAQNGNTEVEASKIALTKSTNAQVKTFAQQMVDDHTKTGDELKTLAASKGVEVSDKPSVAQTAKIKLLDAMDGANFDKRYAAMIGVTAHQDTVKLFQKASSSAKDADVKAFAAKTLPSLQHHLEMAQALKGQHRRSQVLSTPGDGKEFGHSSPDPLPAEADKGSDDGVLDSIGKAISAPIEGAAEDDEPHTDPKKPPVPPG